MPKREIKTKAKAKPKGPKKAQRPKPPKTPKPKDGEAKRNSFNELKESGVALRKTQKKETQKRNLGRKTKFLD